ncbi:MAG: hypothetical protein JWN61_2286 [Pseudonocardiales bacterium]|nr:hypothetical protein [Pseudonocardiales bacterium]
MLISPGLCGVCRHAKANTTKRGTIYLRCTRAGWDNRLVRYPRLPVLHCVGFEAGEPSPEDD